MGILNIANQDKHAKCALQYAEKGLPVGLLESKTRKVYTLLLPSPGLADYTERIVRIIGKIHSDVMLALRNYLHGILLCGSLTACVSPTHRTHYAMHSLDLFQVLESQFLPEGGFEVFQIIVMVISVQSRIALFDQSGLQPIP